MLITDNDCKVYAASSTDWTNGGDIAKRIGVPLANLKSTWRKLVANEVLLLDKETHPARYRRNPNPTSKLALETIRQIESKIVVASTALQFQSGVNDPDRIHTASLSKGYAIVVCSEHAFFQGYFITPDVIEQGRATLVLIRREYASGTITGQQVGDLSKSLHVPGVPESDLPLLYSICAVLVTATLTDPRDESGRIKHFLGALAALSEQSYMIVRARNVDDGGPTTKFEPFDAAIAVLSAFTDKTPDKIMIDLINKDPEVTEIKRRNVEMLLARRT